MRSSSHLSSLSQLHLKYSQIKNVWKKEPIHHYLTSTQILYQHNTIGKDFALQQTVSNNCVSSHEVWLTENDFIATSFVCLLPFS